MAKSFVSSFKSFLNFANVLCLSNPLERTKRYRRRSRFDRQTTRNGNNNNNNHVAGWKLITRNSMGVEPRPLSQPPVKRERQTVSNLLKINSNYQPKFRCRPRSTYSTLLLFINAKPVLVEYASADQIFNRR